MLSIGITGGIGSGKTTVSKIFHYNWNIPVYFADDRAKWFMHNDTETQNFLLHLFGNDVYKNNELQKKIIAEKIFNDKLIKRKWEQYIHKKVINDYICWRKDQNFNYHLHEAALIFEAELTNYFDKIILVTSPIELRIKRLQSKGLTKDEALLRISNQLSDEEKAKKANFIIYNDEKYSLIEQINLIHKNITVNI